MANCLLYISCHHHFILYCTNSFPFLQPPLNTGNTKFVRPLGPKISPNFLSSHRTSNHSFLLAVISMFFELISYDKLTLLQLLLLLYELCINASSVQLYARPRSQLLLKAKPLYSSTSASSSFSSFPIYQYVQWIILLWHYPQSSLSRRDLPTFNRTSTISHFYFFFPSNPPQLSSPSFAAALTRYQVALRETAVWENWMPWYRFYGAYSTVLLLHAKKYTKLRWW